MTWLDRYQRITTLWVGRGRAREDVRPFFEFLVVAKYGHEVIDRVQVDETNRLGRAAPTIPTGRRSGG